MTRTTTAALMSTALALMLAACGQQAGVAETQGPTSSAAPTETASSELPSDDPATESASEPTAEPTTDTGSDGRAALPTLSTVDGDPIDVPEPVDVTSLRVGEETVDYEVSGVFSTGIPSGDFSAPEAGWSFVGPTCVGEAVGAVYEDGGIGLGTLVLGSEPDGDAPPQIDSRPIAHPEGIHEGLDHAFVHGEDGSVVWVRMMYDDAGVSTWSILAAGPDDSTARVIASSQMPELAGTSLMGMSADAGMVFLSVCRDGDIPECGLMFTVPQTGGEIRELAETPYDLPDAIRGGAGYLRGEGEGFDSGDYPGGAWALHALIPDGGEVTDAVVVLGEGPTADFFPSFDAEVTDGAVNTFVVAGSDPEDTTGWAVVSTETGATALTAPTRIMDAALTDSAAVVGVEDLGLVIVPRDGSEPWLLQLGVEGARTAFEYFVGAPCGDAIGISAWSHDQSDGVGSVITLLP